MYGTKIVTIIMQLQCYSNNNGDDNNNKTEALQLDFVLYTYVFFLEILMTGRIHLLYFLYQISICINK